jgi:hypothetical protein
MEVDLSWLEPDTASQKPTVRPKKSTPPRRPPTLRGSAARRDTLEVRTEWLEQEGAEAADTKAPEAPPKRRAHPPPLPREEPKSEPPRSRRSTRPPRRPSKTFRSR